MATVTTPVITDTTGQAIVTALQGLTGNTNIASNFSSSSTYAVGELVVYNKNLYKCHTAVLTAGAWTGSTNWTATTVEAELALKRNTTDTIPIDKGGTNATTASGARTNLGLGSSAVEDKATTISSTSGTVTSGVASAQAVHDYTCRTIISSSSPTGYSGTELSNILWVSPAS